MDVGTMVDGFRIERLLGSGSLGSVYEATQLSLGRTVALRVLEGDQFSDPGMADRFKAQQRLGASVQHPNIVPTYEAGYWKGGRFVATRFVRGRTLAELLEDGSHSPERLRTQLGPIAEALEAVHRAGLVHGRVTAENVIVDAAGTAHLADLGLGRPGSVAADREAFTDLASRVECRGRRRRRRIRRATAVAAAAIAAAVAAILSLAWPGDGGEADAAPPPAIAGGAAPLGSDLAPGSALSLGCAPEPGPNTPACTLSQSALVGASTLVREAGVIRGWAVRGASGDLALQVIGRRNGRFFLRGFSQVESAPDLGPHAFEANVRIERGDRIGVLLTPGASIGASAAPGGASALRWEGTLDFIPGDHSSSRIGRELLLRADIESGAVPDLSQVTGADAARGAAGSVLAEEVVDIAPSGAVRIELVRVGGGIVIDALRGPQRLARVEVPDAEPAGRVLALDGHCGYRQGFCLRWLNEGEAEPLIHAYRLLPGGRGFQLIG